MSAGVSIRSAEFIPDVSASGFSHPLSLSPAERAELFGAALAFTAGLCSEFDRQSIIDHLYTLTAHRVRLHRLRGRTRTYCDPLEVSGIEQIDDLLRECRPQNTIFALSQMGANVLITPLLVSLGHRIAVVFWEIDAITREILSECEALLIDLNLHRDPHLLLGYLDGLQQSGCALAMVIEAPMNSRRRYRFLGYDVRCASLIEVYAKRSGNCVVPLASRLPGENNLEISMGEPIMDGDRLTQTLLSWVECQIYLHHDHYNWSTRSIIFTDQCALLNALAYAEDILQWRAQLR
jgi:hypothetical protein